VLDGVARGIYSCGGIPRGRLAINTGKRDYFHRARGRLDVPGHQGSPLDSAPGRAPGAPLFFYAGERDVGAGQGFGRRRGRRSRGRPSVKGIADEKIPPLLRRGPSSGVPIKTNVSRSRPTPPWRGFLAPPSAPRVLKQSNRRLMIAAIFARPRRVTLDSTMRARRRGRIVRSRIDKARERERERESERNSRDEIDRPDAEIRSSRGMIYRARNDATRRPSSAGSTSGEPALSRARSTRRHSISPGITFAALILIGCAGPVK